MLENVAKFFLSFSHDIVIIPLVILGYIWLEQKVFFNAICLILVSILFNFALKITFQIPLPAHLGKQGFAFPSGHMQTSVVLYGWIITKLHSNMCKLLIIGLLSGIGMSLVYFGYHNYFDILGAIFFASLLISCYTFLVNATKPILPLILLDFLHKSKIVKGFLGKTKLSTAAYMDVREEHRQVLTTKSSTRSTYAGSLLSFSTFLMLYIASLYEIIEHLWMAYYALIGIVFSQKIFTKRIININLLSKIVATILCFTVFFVVKILFTIDGISSLPIPLRQVQWVIIGFCIPASVFVSNYLNHYKNSFYDRS